MERYNFTQNLNFDVIIIGGGISGATMVHEAALKGLRPLLVEMNDFGSATSAATSKLIHGGLRYLKNFELGLVRESLRERKILGDIAPNFVEPLAFVLPNQKEKKITNLTLKAGMVLYDLLSYDKANLQNQKNALPSHSTLTLEELIERNPFMKGTSFSHATCYYDYANLNPDRMTLAFLQTAQENGAKIANYAKVVGFLKAENKEGNQILGVKIEDRLDGKIYEVKAPWVINCGGTWVDNIIGLLGEKSTQSRKILRSEGVHIITDKIKCQDAVGLQTSEKGHLFFLPWRGLTLVGPTEKPYDQDPSSYKPTSESIKELIENINAHVPKAQMGGEFKKEDIRFVYGGLRPLIGIENPEDSYNASRKHEIVDHNKDRYKGFLSVEGGKYTTSRNLAEQTFAYLKKNYNLSLKNITSETVVLSPCHFPKGFETFLQELQKQFSADFSSETILYYATNYGNLATEVLNLAVKNPHLKKTLTPDGEILAEVVYATEHELCFSLEDLLFRRTGIGLMGKIQEEDLKQISQILAQKLGWTEKQTLENLEKFKEHYNLQNLFS
ncbi:MAG: glycerol-3-phosphate dehydrogenase [Flavobacteriaceae bacterium]|nr:MAG: glycerol-3-phosphate dehydrogenase [Flavobacteriaceae bacterium]